MEKNFIKKAVFIVLAGIISMYLFSGVVLADTSQIDLNTLEDIGVSTTPSSTTETTTESTTETTATEPTNNNIQTNNAIANTEALPQTGSTTEIIFIIGITILAGTTIYIYRKTKIF